MKYRVCLCVLGCFGLVVGANAQSAARAGAASQSGPGSIAERYLFSAANAERAQRGLGQLRWDAVLYSAARTHCHEMAERQSISHQYPGEPELTQRGRIAGVKFSTIAENVAEAPTAGRIHDAWMHSPGHRANLLDPTVDSVAISVLERNGQLYAVEDFDRSVQVLTLDQQEAAVGSLMTQVADVALGSPEEARQTCSMESGYAGHRTPLFVMRYTSSDLTTLPQQLKSKLATGQYREAAVGACEAKTQQPFTSFHVAVLLYQ